MGTSMRAALALFLFLAFAPLAYAAPHRVVAVSNGDTITAEPIQGGKRAIVRLHGIDCPKATQPYGREARGFVSDLILFETVDVQPTPQGADSSGRIIALVNVPGEGVLQELLLQAGLAWVWTRHCKDCGEWEAMQEKAKAERKGLWADKKPMEPWKWKRGK